MTNPPHWMTVICPYCEGKAVCRPCDAYVGVHKDDGKNRPLGRLANKELREWKKAAHAAFDPLWQGKMKRDRCSKGQARKAGYFWLSKQLDIKFRDCHIGEFGVDMCRKVVEVCGQIG